MNEFLLFPFFIVLSADGIPVTLDDYERVARVLSTGGEWDRKRLRGVLMALLVHGTEQTEIFKRRFDAFFEEDLSGKTLTAEQIEKILAELKNFSAKNPKKPEEKIEEEKRKKDFSPIPIPAPPLPAKNFWQKLLRRLPSKKDWQIALTNLWNLARRKFSVWHVIALLLAAALVFGIYWFLPSPSETKGGEKKPNATPTQRPPIPQPVTAEQQPPNAVKVERAGEPQRQPLVEHSWSDFAGAVGLAAFPFVAWLLFSLIFSQFGKEPPPKFDSKKPRLFSLRDIGGEPYPQLNAPTLDHLADSLSYFLSENQGKRLDVEASVRAAGRNAGLPVLHFERLKKVRSIYILEDANADPLAWNPIAEELAEGLSKRGISVRYGKFYGTPDKFLMQEGGAEYLEDSDTQSQDSLFLFFSDGKHLSPTRDAFLLESLGRSASVAWLDLREKEFWDESAELIKNHGIPLYQANADGLSRAMQRFLTERSSESDDAEEVKRWRGVPANTGANLAAYVESLLGDALAWAQACAMIQPVSNGMADALRRKFQNHLPPERLERLYRLPGASWNVSGLRFSLPVLAILRHGFTIRWSAEEQREILEFIIEQIKLLEPQEKDSLSHLSWEWTLERVRLELDPDAALRRIAQLSELDAYKNSIKNEFSKLVLPDAAGANADQIPLRVRPLTQDGLDKFGKLSGQTIKRNDFWESLKAIRHRFVESMRRIRQTVEFFLNAARKLPDKLFGTPAAPPHVIIAEPAELRFKSLRTNEAATLNLTLKRTDGAGLSGRIVTDAAWLRIHKSLCDNLHPQHTTLISAETSGLKTGNHSAVITFVSADGTPPLEIEVSARVVRSWLDAFADWWRENRPSSAMRVALLGLFIGLIALAAAEYALPRNWLNALYNNAPELIGRLEHDLTNAQNLRLTAKIKNDDGESLQDSRWEVEMRPKTAKPEVAPSESWKNAELPSSPRIMLVMPEPNEWGKTSAEAHLQELERTLSKVNSLHVCGKHLCLIKTWEDFQEQLPLEEPDILYYYGHGDNDTTNSKLIFASRATNAPVEVSAAEFANALRVWGVKTPRLTYINCCLGDAGGLLGIGRQLGGIVPAVITNCTLAQVETAQAQALDIWRSILLDGLSPHEAVAAMRKNLAGRQAGGLSDARWLAPIVHCGYENWNFKPPKVYEQTIDPNWEYMLDRITPTGVAMLEAGYMFDNGKPRALAFIWYGKQFQGVAEFYKRLEIELQNRFRDVGLYSPEVLEENLADLPFLSVLLKDQQDFKDV